MSSESEGKWGDSKAFRLIDWKTDGLVTIETSVSEIRPENRTAILHALNVFAAELVKGPSLGILMKALRGTGIGIAIGQAMLLVAFGIFPGKMNHGERMEFIARNGLQGLIAASVAIAAREKS